MARTRNPLHHKQKNDEQRFRFRVRFERPPGAGGWDLERTLFAWLDQRIGKGNYAFYPDYWVGHGLGYTEHNETYALHFDDHTIIPDLLMHYDGIYLEVTKPVQFRAVVQREQLRRLRASISQLQRYLVDYLNKPYVRVTWAMGQARFMNGNSVSIGDNIRVGRINELTQIDGLLSVVPPEGQDLTVMLSDYLRGALEMSVVNWRDKRPPPTPEELEPLQRFIETICQV